MPSRQTFDGQPDRRPERCPDAGFFTRGAWLLGGFRPVFEPRVAQLTLTSVEAAPLWESARSWLRWLARGTTETRKTYAALFAPDAGFVDVLGRLQQGRTVIARDYEGLFAAIYRGSGPVCLGCTHAQPKKSAAPTFRRKIASHTRALTRVRDDGEPTGQLAARELELDRLRSALRRAQELDDDVAHALVRMSTCCGPMGTGPAQVDILRWSARALQVWNRAPEPKASPLPSTVTYTRTSWTRARRGGRCAGQPLPNNPGLGRGGCQ